MVRILLLVCLLAPSMSAPADLDHLEILDFKVYQSVAGQPTLAGFVVRNDNPDSMAGAVLTVKPGNGAADLVRPLPDMGPGDLVVLSPQWIYELSGTQSGTIRLEWNSTWRDIPFSADVKVPNLKTISGTIIDGNTGQGMVCNVHYGLYHTVSDNQGKYSLQYQAPKFDYLMYAQYGYYIWVDTVRLNGDIIVNMTSPY